MKTYDRGHSLKLMANITGWCSLRSGILPEIRYWRAFHQISATGIKH
jgi:hypothetical protein